MSIAVPLNAADRTWLHILAQVREFGSLAIAPADERIALFNADPPAPPSETLLHHELASHLLDHDRDALIDRLKRLLDDEQSISELARTMHPGIKFAGAFTTWTEYESRSPVADQVFEVARLRAELACRLRWPHSLEWIKQFTYTEDPWGYGAAIVERVERELKTFKCIWENPLAE